MVRRMDLIHASIVDNTASTDLPSQNTGGETPYVVLKNQSYLQAPALSFSIPAFKLQARTIVRNFLFSAMITCTFIIHSPLSAVSTCAFIIHLPFSDVSDYTFIPQ